MSKFLINILSLVCIISFSCTASKIENENLEHKIVISDIKSWLNLMPGGPGTFHISGTFDIIDSSDVNINLINICIYSSNKLIYKINPELFPKDESISKRTWIKTFQFYNQAGLKIDDAIKSIEKIDVKLVFDFDGYLIDKFINNVELTRAY